MKDYLSFWQVTKPVFNYPSDSEDVFFTEAVRKILDRVFLFSKHAGNLIILTAPAGHGKSCISRYLYQGLPTSSHEVLLISLVLDERKGDWLLPKLATFFGIVPSPEDSVEYLRNETLKRFDDLIEEGKQLVVIIDSAEKISTPQALQEIHTLLGIQALASTCLSFILIGSDRLNSLLKNSPLISRANLASQIKPLSLNETETYLKSQLKAAAIDENVFKRPVFKPIHEMSGGIFARINAIAENCLIEACLQGKKSVDVNTVAAASEFVANYTPDIVGNDVEGEKSLATKAKPAKVSAEKTEETHFPEDANQDTKSALRIAKSANPSETETSRKETYESKLGKTKPKQEPKKTQDQPIKLKNLFKNNEAG